jgi:hypothetical protein
MTEAPPMLDSNEIVRLAEALEGPGDVAALLITAEVVMREFALVNAVLNHGWGVRQDGSEWAFLDPEGVERGRIFDVPARPPRAGSVRDGS